QGTGTNRPKTYTQPTATTIHPITPNPTPPPTTPSTTPTKYRVTAEIATGKRPDPSRTRKLSLPAPMILPNPGGKVGHRRTQIRITPHQHVGGDSFYSLKKRWRYRVSALLQGKQCALTVQPSAVSGEAAVRADHPVA